MGNCSWDTLYRDCLYHYFSAGLFVKTYHTGRSLGWGIVGLLGAAMMMTNLLITNGIEILAFYDFTRLSE